MDINKSSLPDISAPARLTSIDMFRFIAIVMLVFFSLVHDGSFKISNIPSWMWHAEPPTSMTIVDVGSPFFIFIIGMCIPLSINRRLEKTKSQVRLWMHIIFRTVSLMIMGITMGNLWNALGDPYAVVIMGDLWNVQPPGRPLGMSINLWGVLLFISFFLIWSRYPISQGLKRNVFTAMRIGGLVLLAYLAAIFRRDDDLSWFKFGEWGFWSWWVLGILGWTYLISSVIYMLFRKHLAGVIGCFVLLIFMFAADNAGVFNHFGFLDDVRRYVPFGTLLGTWPSISTAGVIVGMLYSNNSPAKTPLKRIILILVFAAGLFIAGYLLYPLYGISSGEGRATPTWAMYSSAISCVIFAFLYWLMDVMRKRRWADFFLPIGENPLLLYLLCRMIHPFFSLLHIDFINRFCNSGIAGVLRTAMYTVILLLFSRYLITRFRIVLRL